MSLELDGSSIRNVVILTGAGASAPSGLPICRGPGGVWDDAFHHVLVGRAELLLPALLSA